MKYSNGCRLVAALSLLLISGCSPLAPQRDNTHYFVVSSVSSGDGVVATSGPTTGQKMTIGLGPIVVPKYLDRPEVITRVSDTEFVVSDTDRWGEPLDVGVARALTEDLSAHLPNAQILRFPWSSKTTMDFRVLVDFSRFERTADGRTQVRATWFVRDGKDSKLLQEGSSIVDGVPNTNDKSGSTALSLGIAKISREIADAVQTRSQIEASRRD